MSPKETAQEAAAADTVARELSPAERLQRRSAEQKQLLKRFQQKIKSSGALTSIAIHQTIAKDVVEKMRNLDQQYDISSKNTNETRVTNLETTSQRGGGTDELQQFSTEKERAEAHTGRKRKDKRGSWTDRMINITFQEEIQQVETEKEKIEAQTGIKRKDKRGSWTDRMIDMSMASLSLIGQKNETTAEDDAPNENFNENHASVFEEMESLSNSQRNASTRASTDPRARRRGRRGSDASANSSSTNNRRSSMTSRRSSFSDISTDDVTMRELLAEGSELKQQFGNLQARRGSIDG